jgi:hypothetical protein
VEVASFCSLPIGVVRWHGAGPTLSVVVKATFSISGDGEASLAPLQEPLSLERPDPDADRDGLLTPSDFAPQKARADVMLVGHAFAPEPSRTIPARLVLDVLDLAFVGVSPTETELVRLVPRSLRAGVAASAPAIAVGPRAATDPERAARGLGSRVDRFGVVRAPLGPAPDFGFFNTAPFRQQLGLLRPNASLWMQGLTPGGGTRSIEFPGHRPRVFAMGARGEVREAVLSIDTLFIDTDRQVATLAFRGIAPVVDGGEPVKLVLALEPRGSPCNWSMLRARLDVATPLRAVEADDLRAAGPLELAGGTTGSRDLPERRTLIRPEDVDGWADSVDDEETDDGAEMRARRATLVLPNSSDTTADGSEAGPGAASDPLVRTRHDEGESRPLADALPFRRGLGVRLASWEKPEDDARPRPPSVPPDRESTSVLTRPEPRPVLPFGGPAARVDEESTGVIEPGKMTGRTLPFVPNKAALPPVVAPPRKHSLPPSEESTSMLDPEAIRARAVVPFTPAAGDGGRLVAVPPVARAAPEAFPAPEPRVEAPRSARPGRSDARIPLETYAALKRDIWAGGEIEGALADRGLSIVSWLEQERLWAEALREEVVAGRVGLATMLCELLRTPPS